MFPLFGLHASLAGNMELGAVLSIVPAGRNHTLRRLFEAIRARGAGAGVPAVTRGWMPDWEASMARLDQWRGKL